MNTLQAEYQVETLAQAVEVSPSGYYAHQHNPQRALARQDQALAAAASMSVRRPHTRLMCGLSY